MHIHRRTTLHTHTLTHTHKRRSWASTTFSTTTPIVSKRSLPAVILPARPFWAAIATRKILPLSKRTRIRRVTMPCLATNATTTTIVDHRSETSFCTLSSCACVCYCDRGAVDCRNTVCLNRVPSRAKNQPNNQLNNRTTNQINKCNNVK